MAKLVRPARLQQASRKASLPGLSPRLVLGGISLLFGSALFASAIWFGLDVLRSSTLRSNVMALAGGGQQIAAAQGLYRTDHGGTGAPVLHDLVPGYMSREPAPPTAHDTAWRLASDGLAAVSLGPAGGADVAETCAEAARQAGFPGAIPGVVADGKVAGLVGAFGCARDARTGDMLFVHRLP